MAGRAADNLDAISYSTRKNDGDENTLDQIIRAARRRLDVLRGGYSDTRPA